MEPWHIDHRGFGFFADKKSMTSELESMEGLNGIHGQMRSGKRSRARTLLSIHFKGPRWRMVVRSSIEDVRPLTRLAENIYKMLYMKESQGLDAREGIGGWG